MVNYCYCISILREGAKDSVTQGEQRHAFKMPPCVHKVLMTQEGLLLGVSEPQACADKSPREWNQIFRSRHAKIWIHKQNEGIHYVFSFRLCVPLVSSKWYKWTCLQNRNRVTDVGKKTYGYQVGRGWGGINWEIRIDIHTLLYIKFITNKNLLYSTGDSTQYSVMTYVRKESKKRVNICMCITDSLCCTPETKKTL